MAGGPAVALGGRDSTGPGGFSFLIAWTGAFWLAGCEGLEAADGGGDVAGPWPSGREAEPEPAAAADEASGGRGQPQPWLLGFPVRSSVRAGVPGPQHDGQRLAVAIAAVISEHRQGMEPPGLLPRRRGLLLVGVSGHDSRVDIDRDQAATRARCRRPGQVAKPGL
jgi:hypothetical protein